MCLLQCAHTHLCSGSFSEGRTTRFLCCICAVACTCATVRYAPCCSSRSRTYITLQRLRCMVLFSVLLRGRLESSHAVTFRVPHTCGTHHAFILQYTAGHSGCRRGAGSSVLHTVGSLSAACLTPYACTVTLFGTRCHWDYWTPSIPAWYA